MGTKEIHTGCWWGHLKEREQLEDLGVNERVILKWILTTQDGRNVDWKNLAQAGIYMTPCRFYN
jgi:hypothetical protein